MNEQFNVDAASSAQLVEFYNQHAEAFGKKRVSKFSDKETGKLRVRMLIADMEAEQPPAPATETATEQPPAPATERTSHAVDPKRSEGVKASWCDPEVKAARSARHAVLADGVEYKSVAAAFKALGIGPKDIIKLRAELVAYGEQSYGQHDFKLVKAS